MITNASNLDMLKQELKLLIQYLVILTLVGCSYFILLQHQGNRLHTDNINYLIKYFVWVITFTILGIIRIVLLISTSMLGRNLKNGRFLYINRTTIIKSELNYLVQYVVLSFSAGLSPFLLTITLVRYHAGLKDEWLNYEPLLYVWMKGFILLSLIRLIFICRSSLINIR